MFKKENLQNIGKIALVQHGAHNKFVHIKIDT